MPFKKNHKINNGRKHSKDWETKRIKAIKDGGKLKLKRKPCSVEKKQKISKSNKGKKPSNFAIINSVNTRIGIPLSEEHKKKIGRSGIDSGVWKGGISKDINKYMINYRRINNEKKAGRKTPELCEICGIPGSELKRGLCFDHDHNTGNFRGWLCSRCNTALGLVSDNTETLIKMIKYLQKHKNINGLS